MQNGEMVPLFSVRSLDILNCRMDSIHPQNNFYILCHWSFLAIYVFSDIERKYVKVICRCILSIPCFRITVLLTLKLIPYFLE